MIGELELKKRGRYERGLRVCRWPLSAGEDEEVLYEEHCNHCPVALAVDALCEALRPETTPGTNLSRLAALDAEGLADEIFDNLAQFPSRDALLAYLQQEATE